MKRIVCSLLLVALMAVMLAPAVLAAGTSVAVSSETAKPGDEVVLNVTMTGNTGFATGKYVLSYDSDALTLVEMDVTGKLLSNGLSNINLEEKLVNFANTVNVTADGVLFTAKFKVAEEAADGEYEVTVAVQDVVNANGEAVDVAVSAGKVTVATPPPPPPPHVCEGTLVEKVEADCDENGKKAHYVCECGKLYSDKECTTEVTEEDLVIKATGHDWEWKTDKEPTQTETGLKHEECKTCGEKRNEGTVIDKLEEDFPPIPPTGDTMALMAVAAIMSVVAAGGVYATKRKFSK